MHLRQGLRGFAGMIRVLRDPGQIRLYRLSKNRERDMRPALKECSAELPLQCDDCVGKGWLRDATASGRAREIALVAECQEVANLVHLHFSTSAPESRSTLGTLPLMTGYNGELSH